MALRRLRREEFDHGTAGQARGGNFGHAHQLSYTGALVLKDLLGGGHYGTVKAHSERWKALVRRCRSEDGPGVNDARRIDRQTLLDSTQRLRHHVEHGSLNIANAQNRLSSVTRALYGQLLATHGCSWRKAQTGQNSRR